MLFFISHKSYTIPTGKSSQVKSQHLSPSWVESPPLLGRRQAPWGAMRVAVCQHPQRCSVTGGPKTKYIRNYEAWNWPRSGTPKSRNTARKRPPQGHSRRKGKGESSSSSSAHHKDTRGGRASANPPPPPPPPPPTIAVSEI